MNHLTHLPGSALLSWTTWTAAVLLCGSLLTGCTSSNAHAEATAHGDHETVSEAAAATTPSLNAPEQLTAVIPGLLEQHIVPGLTVCLMEQGEVSWTGAFGVRRVTDNAPMTEDTVFEAAGLVLPMMAQLAVELSTEQALDLEQPIGELLPDLPPDARKTRGATMAKLLSQSAELTGAKPGEKPFLHSPEGVRLAQRVLEQAGGAPLSYLLSQRVFLPLGMESTSMVWRDDYNTRSAAGHGLPSRLPLTVRRKGRPTVADAPTTLHTTAGDMARFTLASLGSKSPSVRAALLSPRASMGGALSHGLGWALEAHGDSLTAYQWGASPHFRALVLFQPQNNSGLVVLTNGLSGHELMAELVAAFDGQEFTLFSGPRPGSSVESR